MPTPAALRITSWNILADAYATPRLFPDVPRERIAWKGRANAIIDRLVELDADVACLQEVDAVHWPDLFERLSRRGLSATFAQKRRGRPDGCALVWNPTRVPLRDSRSLHFDDGIDDDAASGHVALIGRFDHHAGSVTVVSTHLRWQASSDDPSRHIGYRQALELRSFLRALPSTDAVVVCGDFNATASSPPVNAFIEHGFRDAYRDVPQPTCVANRRAQRIDFILWMASAFGATAAPLPAVDDNTSMPSSTEPSDHLPITANFTRRA